MKNQKEITVQIRFLIESRSAIDIDQTHFLNAETGKPTLIPFQSHHDGTYTLREAYEDIWQTEDALIANLRAALKDDYELTIIETDDYYNEPPKLSYFEIRFSVAEILPRRR